NWNAIRRHGPLRGAGQGARGARRAGAHRQGGAAVSSGAGVTWNRPGAYFKQSTTASRWSFDSGPGMPYTTAMALDLLEHWTP
ncbi:hypothetical protein KDK88_02275, partial [bacterium]|nr:hypothetical protein [bacterium]